jgi:16S rRNA (guanine1207-N2)-methyltransferase
MEAEWLCLKENLRPALSTLALMPDSSHFFESSEQHHLTIYHVKKDQLNFFQKKDLLVVDRLESDKNYQQVLWVPTQNKCESLGLLAKGLELLSDDGWLIFSCANDRGAKSYMSHLKKIFPQAEFESKHKCRYAMLFKNQAKGREQLQEWSDAYKMQKNDWGYFSFPGIYGWNKIDRGSELLLETLPDLSGVGADLGAGYGYLSCEIFKSNNLEKMYLVENDLRALMCSRENLASYTCDFFWKDIRGEELEIKNVDFVVMNPPFHQADDIDYALGRSFIHQAKTILKKNGRLFMVANQFLAYEDLLLECFGGFKKVLQKDGFKVLHA